MGDVHVINPKVRSWGVGVELYGVLLPRNMHREALLRLAQLNKDHLLADSQQDILWASHGLRIEAHVRPGAWFKDITVPECAEEFGFLGVWP